MKFSKWLWFLLPSFTCFAEVTVDSPQNGWRNSQSEATGFMQSVHYPASSVNTEGHATATLIKGHIQNHKKGKPAKLVVNGVAMPLLVNDQGNFARPYAFGSGSNSVEVRNEKNSQKVQFFDNNTHKTQSRLRVVLSWDTNQTDLDLHVVAPDGNHVYYGERIANNGAALDLDVTTGYGPEIYANPTPVEGVYHVFVNYYGGGSSEQKPITTAQVAIITQEGTVSEKRQVVQVPLRKAGELTLIKSFSYP